MSASRAAPSPGAPYSSAHPRDGFDPQRVLADRVEQLYSQMPLGMLATLAIGGIATYELWEERTRDLVLFWWGLVLLVTAARAVLYFGYRASTRKLGDGAQWGMPSRRTS